MNIEKKFNFNKEKLRVNLHKVEQMSFSDLKTMIEVCAQLIPYYSHPEKKDQTMVDKLNVIAKAIDVEMKKRLNDLIIYLD